jgi:hypothetical protein
VKRFILVTNIAADDSRSRNALTAFLNAKGFSVWHWFTDLWLLSNVPINLSASQLRQEIMQAVPSITNFMIFSPDSANDYAGFVPTPSISWLDEHWRKP